MVASRLADGGSAIALERKMGYLESRIARLHQAATGAGMEMLLDRNNSAVPEADLAQSNASFSVASAEAQRLASTVLAAERVTSDEVRRAAANDDRLLQDADVLISR